MGRGLPEGTYIELVGSLFATLLPTIIMAISFSCVGLLISHETSDQPLIILSALGSAAALARIVNLLLHRKEAVDASLVFERANILERRFAATYFSFALVLGAFGSRAFVVASPESRVLLIGLLFGYGAGVAAGLSLRPWISVPSILIAIIPTIVTAWLSANPSYWATGALLAVFLAGGVESMIARYRSTARKITMSRTFSTLARRDDLTGLPNRLSLREHFEAFAGQNESGGTIAVHCLDLDRFKPVNDRFGHPVGDALLKAVSDRLNGLLRRSDFAARIGGDEFVIAQTGVAHAGEVDILARRVVRAISQPYVIDAHEITIGTSLGYALSADCGNDLDRLISYADNALCKVKGRGGGIAAYCEQFPEIERRVSA